MNSHSLNFAKSERTVTGNNPLPLNEPNTVWLISSGSMAVFAVVTVNGAVQGARRYLFDAHSGDALFGMATPLEGQSHALIAVAYEETHLVAVSVDEWVEQSKSNDREIKLQMLLPLQQWSDRLTAVFRNTDIVVESLDLDHPPSSLVDRLHPFHADFLLGLHQLNQKEGEMRTEQFRSRLQLNQQASERAIANLTAIFRPKEAEFFQEGTPLLIAAGAVGRALGIDIRPPARSEDPKRVKDPLAAIARASRIRTRRIILRGVWWESDCGPLLGYTAQEERPVALLPVKANCYEIFDPQQQKRIPLNADSIQLLSPVAYMFYRPFGERALQWLDILKFMTRGRERDLLAIILLGIAAALLEMLTPQATGILIDKAIPDAERSTIFQIALALLAVTFGKSLFELVQNIAAFRVESKASSQTQAATWDRLLNLRVSFFRQYSTGDLQSRVSAIAKIRELINGNVLRTLFSSFFSLLNLGLLFTYSSQLAWVALVLALVNFMFTTFAGSLSRRNLLPLEELQGETFGLTVQLIGGVSKLRVAGAEERAFAYWSKRFSQYLAVSLNNQAVESGVTLFNTLMPTISSMLIFALVVTLTLQSKGAGMSAGNFLAFNSAFGVFISGTASLSNTIVSILEVFALAERVSPILTETPEVDEAKTNPGRLAGGVKLDRVSFRYREDGPLTLDKVSIEAKPGEFIALVGPSGSGKSTLVRLLLGFEQPEDGIIYFDGQDLSGLDIAAVRRQFGVVLQNGRINSASIFENICSGAQVTMDETWVAARMAGFAEDIEQMPMGMHTVISEGGTNLSGGQRQRLLIARALVLNPKILIFDEATSALDNRTQAIVSESLEKLQVTRFVIAHRLSTIRNADRIYVMAAGQVMQQGTFEELMVQPGLFADLMARQVA